MVDTSKIIQPSIVSLEPLEGQDLNRFLQPPLVKLTGLLPTHVIPMYQDEPPNIPQAGDVWCGFWVQRLAHDTMPYIKHKSNTDSLQRHELLSWAIDFYDLGVNGLASKYVTLVRDNLTMPVNREWMLAANFNLRAVAAPIIIPVIFKQRWQYRERLTVYLSRNIMRDYPVPDLLKGQIKVNIGNLTITKTISN